jgi:DNA-binding NtrC family response regulator
MAGQFRIEGSFEPEEAEKSFFMMVKVCPTDGLDSALAKFERQMIQNALQRNKSSIEATAKELKMTRHALSYRRKKLDL